MRDLFHNDILARNEIEHQCGSRDDWSFLRGFREIGHNAIETTRFSALSFFWKVIRLLSSSVEVFVVGVVSMGDTKVPSESVLPLRFRR